MTCSSYGGPGGAQHQLLSAGVWAPALGQLAGVHVPLVGMHHAYVVTERIEGIQVSPTCCRSLLCSEAQRWLLLPACSGARWG